MKKITQASTLILFFSIFVCSLSAQQTNTLCYPTYTTSYGNYGIFIYSVTSSGGYTNLSNTTSPSAASAPASNDYRSQVLSAFQGDAITINILPSGNNPTHAGVYIDLDNDGSYSSLELQGSATGVTYSSGGAAITFTLPAVTGDFNLRTILGYNTAGTYSFTDGCTMNNATLGGLGESEDYTISISEAPSCGSPSGFTATVDDFAVGSTTLSWTAGDNNDSYSWAVYTGSDTTATPAASGTTSTTSASVSGLSNNTLYTAVVTSACGLEAGLSQSTTFTTNHLVTGAYSEDFGTYTALSFASQMGTSGGSWYNAAAGINFAAFTGDASPYMPGTGPTIGGGTDGGSTDIYWSTYYTTATSGSDVIFTPYFDVSAMTTPRLSIDYHINGTSAGNLTVTLIQSDGTETDVISYTGAQQTSNSDSWRTGYADLSSYDEVVRFKITGTYGGSVSFDDFIIEETPSCGSPTALSASIADFAMGSATLSWTAGGNNDSYSWAVYTGSDTTATPAASGTTSTTSASVSGLLSNTSYTAVVSALCGLESGQSTSVTTFTTNNLVTGAYSEDFGTYTALSFASQMGTSGGSWYNAAAGINFAAFTGDASPYMPGTGPTIGGGTDGGSTDIYWSTYYTTATSGSDVIFTPYFDVSAMTTPRLSIDYHINGTSAGNLTVTLIQSDGTETDVISYTGAQQTSNSDSWRTGYADLSSYDEVVRFKITGTYGGSVSFDDFIIEETPSCSPPSSLTVSNVTSSSATYTWTADSTNTDFSYSTLDVLTEVASASGSTTSGATTVNVTGLSPNTTYTVSVTGICGSETVSPITATFTTSCESVTTGFSQNFNGLTDIPSCWEVVNGGSSNTWVYNTNGYINLLYNSSTHDDYLKSPAFTVSDGLTDGFSFQAQNYNAGYQEQIDIIVEDQTNGTSTIIESAYAPLTGSFESKFYDLSAYEGSDVRISFHSTTLDQWNIFLDNFVVGSASSMAAGWAGFTSTSYSDAQNWYAGSVPTGDVTLNLNSDSASNSPTIDSTVSASSLTVDTGVSLTISENGSLQTTGDFTNGGTVTMNSTATAHSSLIVGGSSTGSITYNRYVDIDRWYITSSPVSGQDIDTFISNEDLAVSTNNSSLVGLADYNNDGSQYAADPTITTGWWDYHQSGQSDSGNFTSGKGKIVRLASDATDNLLGFTGTISGSVSIPMTVATTAFNLIGNPYPAAVQVTSQGGGTDALSANSSGLSEVTAWFWNGSTNGYEVVNQSPSQATKIAAPGQGFFVNAAGSGDFSFTPSMQTTTAGSFNRQTEWSKIDLSMSADGQTSDTEIVYFDGATTGWDNGYDSTNWSSGSFQIFTSHVDTSTTQNLAIQSLPLGNFNDMVVPVGVNASAGQMITISVDTTNWPEDVNIYLEDVDNGSYTLLDGQNAEFTTLLDSNESGIGRFYIHTTSNSLGDDDLTLTDVSIYASSRDNLRILGINSGEANVQMFDLMGKQVLNTSFNGQSVNDVKLPNLNTGIYLVNLASDEGTVNKKIIIQ